MNKKRFLKSILATSALAAAIAPGAAFGANNDTGGDPANMNTGVNLNHAYVADETIKLGGAHDISANKAGAVYGVDVNSNNGQTITLTEDNTITGIIDSSGAAKTIGIKFGAAKTLTLNGVANAEIAANKYEGTGTIDFDNHDGVLTLSAKGATISHVDNATAHFKGTLNISGAGNTIGNVGATKAVKAINVTAGAGDTTFGTINTQTMSVTGASKVKAAATTVAGVAGTDVAMETGAGEFKLTGAADIGATAGKLKIGAGGITTADDVTIGADGVAESAGKITFTDSKTLSLAGNYEATGGIVVDDAVAKTLTITGAGDTEIASAILSEQNTKVHNVLFKAAGKSITLSNDIGSADKKFNNVSLDSNGAAVAVVLNGKKVHVNGAFDVASTANDTAVTFKGESEIVGKLKSTHASRATINLDGENTDAKVALVADGTQLKSFKVLAGAKDSTLTIGADNANKSLTLDALDFANATADDRSGLVIDLSGIANKGNPYALSLGATTIVNNGAHGGIKITGSQFASDDVVGVTLTANVGEAAKHLASFDAEGHKVKLTGNEFHTKDFKATEVELDNVTLGMYNPDASGQVGKLIVKTNNGTIADNSKLREGTEVHFAADKTFTLGDDVALTGTVTALTNTHGKLILGPNGGNVVNLTSAGASGKEIKTIQFTGGNNKTSSLEIAGTAYVSELDIAGAGTLNFNGHLKGKVGVAVAGQGVLVMKGGSIEGTVGDANAVHNLTLDTADEIVVGSKAGSTVAITTLNFKDKNGTLNIHKNATLDGGDLATVTTEKKHVGNIILNQNATTKGNIGTEDLPINTLTVQENKTFTVAGHDVHAGLIRTNVNNKGTVAFTNADSTSTNTSFGSADARFANVTAAAFDVNVLDVYSHDFALGGNNFTTRNLDVAGLAGVTGAGTITLKDGGSLVASKVADANGNVATLGSATIGAAGAGMTIGGTLNTKGSALGKDVTLNASKVSGVTDFGAGTVKFGNNVTFENNVTATNANLDFGAHQATLSGVNKTFEFAGNATVTTDGKVTPIIADTLTVGANDVISIKLNGMNAKGFAIAQKASGAAPDFTNKLTDANFEVTGNKLFKGVTFDDTTGQLVVVKETDVNNFASKELLANTHTKDFMSGVLKASGNISDADKLNVWYTEVFQNLSDSDQNTIVSQLADNSQVASSSNTAALNMAHSAIDARGSEVAAFADGQGVAAGDAADKFGLWAKGTFGTASQKLRKGEAGYKSSSYGAFVGVDTMLNDRASAGLVLGYSNDRMKLKDQRAGGKTKANSWMFGAYGTYDLPQNFFVQGNAAVAQTAVKTTESRLSDKANAKYDVIGYTAEVRGGYKLRFDNSLITPTAGLRFNYLGDTSYTETGSKNGNKKVAGAATTALDAVAGVTLSTALDVDGMVFNPEVHMNVDYALSNKAPKVDYNLDGSAVKFNYKGAKPAKFGYNFGASVMTQADNVEYGVGYDARISDKYMGHTGSVKVKVSF